MIRIIHGEVRDRLRDLAPESVHMVVTSPPYYGLRDYGLSPQVWGGVAGCEHVWQAVPPRRLRTVKGVKDPDSLQERNTGSINALPKTASCELCGAWLGSLGLEPTVELFIDHCLEVFREVWRVLRRDGTLWLNIADSYAGSGGAHKEGHANPGLSKSYARDGVLHWGDLGTPGHYLAPNGYKPKDLLGVPWRLALALQAEGWWLRSEITWAKRAPMPESTTDRPTSATEKIFLLAKKRIYFYDAEAVKETAISDQPSGNGFKRDARLSFDGRGRDEQWQPQATRNMRNWWLLSPEASSEEHYAAFPTEVPRRAILAGTSEKGVCPACGAPWKRIVKRTGGTIGQGGWMDQSLTMSKGTSQVKLSLGRAKDAEGKLCQTETVGWAPSCKCEAGDPVQATILDPFGGSGTTGLVADQLGRDAILIDIKDEYVEMARRRIWSDAPMLVDVRIER